MTGCGALKMLSHLNRMSGTSLKRVLTSDGQVCSGGWRWLAVAVAKRTHAVCHEAAVGYSDQRWPEWRL